MTREEFKNQIALRFINMEHTADAIYNAITLRQNIVLWGKGGHAKSELAHYALSLFYSEEDLFLLSVDRHTAVSSLVGTLDIPKLLGGEASLQVQHSIMAHKCAIIEEGLDSRVISALKDLLTRGSFCTGAVCYPMRTEVIILCTNHDPLNWAKDDSDKALLRRFHYRCKVEWPKYDAASYMKMFNRVIPEQAAQLEGIAAMAEVVRAKDQDYSPAAVIKDARAYLTYGQEGLVGSTHLTDEHIGYIKTATARARASAEFAELTLSFQTLENTFRSTADIATMKSVQAQVAGILKLIDGLRPDNTLITQVARFRSRALTLHAIIEEGIRNKQKPEPSSAQTPDVILTEHD